MKNNEILNCCREVTIRVKKNMKLSEKGMKLLKDIETLRLKVYDDQTNKDIIEYNKKNKEGATIGYGHLLKEQDGDFEKYKPNVAITKEDADELFLNDLAPFEKKVNNIIKVNLSQQEFDALTILAFNIGNGSFQSSSVVKLVNNPNDPKSNYRTLDEAWMAFNKSQGQVMKGLNKRREAELNIFKKGVYEKW